MYVVVKDWLVQVFHIPNGDFVSFLLLSLLGISIIRLIFK